MSKAVTYPSVTFRPRRLQAETLTALALAPRELSRLLRRGLDLALRERRERK